MPFRKLWGHCTLSVTATLLIPPLLRAQQGYPFWCMSEPGGPVVYFSQAFNAGVSATSQTISNEFLEYLKGRYAYSNNSNYPTSCAAALSLSQAEASRRDWESKTQQQGRQFVEVEWSYAPDSTAAAPPVQHHGPAPITEPADQGWCFTDGLGGTLYVAGPFQGKAPIAIYEWNRGWSRFLAGKYSFSGKGGCYLGWRKQALRLIAAREQGARAGNQKIVETGWVFEPAGSQPTKPVEDEDREPTRPKNTGAGTPAPSSEVRARAAQERKESMTLCNRDRMVAAALDCTALAQQIFNYRITHPTEQPRVPLADFFANDKLDCSKCANAGRLRMWARMRAQSQNLGSAAAKCVGNQFVEKFSPNPYPNRVQTAYDSAVTACRQ